MLTLELNDVYIKKFKANLHACFFNRKLSIHAWLKNKNEYDKKGYRRIISSALDIFMPFTLMNLTFCYKRYTKVKLQLLKCRKSGILNSRNSARGRVQSPLVLISCIPIPTPAPLSHTVSSPRQTLRNINHNLILSSFRACLLNHVIWNSANPSKNNILKRVDMWNCSQKCYFWKHAQKPPQ